MSDLSVPTKVIITSCTGGGQIIAEQISIMAEEPWSGQSRLVVHTTTPAPDWLRNDAFPVDSITASVYGKLLFTGYVVKWEIEHPPNKWIIEAVDVTYVAEHHWLVPDSIEEMFKWQGSAEELVITLLEDECQYAPATITTELPYSFELGVVDPFEFGLESVAGVIERLNGILQTSFWGDYAGGVNWKFRDKRPDAGDPTSLTLAPHRASTRGNLLSYHWYENEEPYRNKVVVYGLPPIVAKKPDAFDADNFPAPGLEHIDNIAILSSSLIQYQGMADEVAELMLAKFSIERGVTWEAIGNPAFHVGVTHLLDIDEYSGLAKVTDVTHTIDGSGYTMRGTSTVGEAPSLIMQMTGRYTERILGAHSGWHVSRCKMVWSKLVEWDAAARLWKSVGVSDDWDFSYEWQDISNPTWENIGGSYTEVAFVHDPHNMDTGEVDGTGAVIYKKIEGYAIAFNASGIWMNKYVTDWDLTPTEIASKWSRVMAMTEIDSPAQQWFGNNWGTMEEDMPIMAEDATPFNVVPSSWHLCMHEPDYTLVPGQIAFGVLAAGNQFIYPPWCRTYKGQWDNIWELDDESDACLAAAWYDCGHIFLYKAVLGREGITGLFCEGVLYADTGYGASWPWAGFTTFSAYSYTTTGSSDRAIWAQPWSYPYGSCLYIMSWANQDGDPKTRHGSAWHDSGLRVNSITDARFGTVPFTSNSVRGTVIKRAVGLGAGGGVQDIDHPSIGGGSLSDWTGVTLFGSIKFGNLIAMEGVIADTEFGDWIERWDSAIHLPFIIDWREPWIYVTYLITNSGQIWRQALVFDTPRETGDYTTPEWELWKEVLAELGDTVLDGQWRLMRDFSLGYAAFNFTRLLNPYTAMLHACGYRIPPTGAGPSLAEYIGGTGVGFYNLAPCGKGGSKWWALDPPCGCDKADDPSCPAKRIVTEPPALTKDGDTIERETGNYGIKLRF